MNLQVRVNGIGCGKTGEPTALKVLVTAQEPATMMKLMSSVKHISGGKLVPHSDLRAGTARDVTFNNQTQKKKNQDDGTTLKKKTERKKKDDTARYATWNVKTLLQKFEITQPA